jgi:hypothetical protein
MATKRSPQHASARSGNEVNTPEAIPLRSLPVSVKNSAARLPDDRDDRASAMRVTK